MIALEEAVIRIPVGEAAGRGIPLSPEYVGVLPIHVERSVDSSGEEGSTNGIVP